ncbi:MAG TPA: glycine cleavage T C-terminal barrel domain-containing protein [Gemmatimonadaceae bacterium]|nr:glycine cleavage T C-terminal barrel domain-containing protein [Gemmatimonadaceae bacterium]
MQVETPGAGNITAVTERAYHALQNGAVVADRSSRLRMRFSGEKSAESLTGLVTSDVAALSAGRGQYAAALTPKGKVITDARIFARTDGFLVDVTAAAAPGWVAMIRKFVNPRLAKYEDVSQNTGDVGIFGTGAATLLRSVLGHDAIPPEVPYANVVAGESLMVARVPDFGVDGFDVIGPRAEVDALRARLAAAGAVEEFGDALLVARIEAGRPEWGVDMDDNLLAQEVDMDRLEAISFTKGCYTGQETVARVHYRGHVNRLLRGLRFSESAVPPVGTELQDAEGKAVGTVKSGAISPRRGAIALAVVRREIEPGSVLRASWSDRNVDATVEQLPFPG